MLRILAQVPAWAKSSAASFTSVSKSTVVVVTSAGSAVVGVVATPVVVVSGRASSLEPYTARIRAELGRTLANSWAAKRALDRVPRTTFAVASTPPIQRALERLARGDPQARGVALAGRLARRVPLSAVS